MHIYLAPSKKAVTELDILDTQKGEHSIEIDINDKQQNQLHRGVITAEEIRCVFDDI